MGEHIAELKPLRANYYRSPKSGISEPIGRRRRIALSLLVAIGSLMVLIGGRRRLVPR